MLEQFVESCKKYGKQTTNFGNPNTRRPWKCSLIGCQFKGSSKENVVIHLRSHFGFKPYECKICNYRCTQKSTFTRHNKCKSHKLKEMGTGAGSWDFLFPKLIRVHTVFSKYKQWAMAPLLPVGLKYFMNENCRAADRVRLVPRFGPLNNTSSTIETEARCGEMPAGHS